MSLIFPFNIFITLTAKIYGILKKKKQESKQITKVRFEFGQNTMDTYAFLMDKYAFSIKS